MTITNTARRVARVYWEDEPAGEREERLKQLRSRAVQTSKIEAYTNAH